MGSFSACLRLGASCLTRATLCSIQVLTAGQALQSPVYSACISCLWWLGHRAPHHLVSAEVKKGDCALRVYCAHASTLRVLQHARHVCCLVTSNPKRQLHTLAIEDFSRRGPQAWCHETREFLVAMDTDLVDLVEVCCSRTPCER